MSAACATLSTPGSWTPTSIARGTGGLVSMMRRLPAPSCVRLMPDTFHDDTDGRAACVIGGSLTADYAALRSGFISRRRAETAQPQSWMVSPSMTNPRPSSESRRASVAAAFWGSTQTTSTPVGPQQVHQPVERDLEGLEGAPPPIDQCDIVLTGRMAAVRGSRCASIAAVLQLQHQFDGPGAGDDDSVLLRAACERDHRFNDSVACWSDE